MLQVAFAWQVWEVMHSSISTMSGNKTCAFNCVSKRMHFTFFCDITINIHLLLWYYKHYIVLNHKSLSNWTRWFYILIEIITSSGLSVSTHRQFNDTNTERKQKLSIWLSGDRSCYQRCMWPVWTLTTTNNSYTCSLKC